MGCPARWTRSYEDVCSKSNATRDDKMDAAATEDFASTLDTIMAGIASDITTIQAEKSDEQRQVEENLDVLFPNELLWRTVSEVVNKRIRAGEEGIPRQYIVCSFDDREQAKELGARWDPDQKKWYALGAEAYSKLARWHPKTPTGPPPPSVPPSPSPSAGGPMPRMPVHRPHGVSAYTRDDMARFRK